MNEPRYDLRSGPSGGTSAGRKLDPTLLDPDFYGWRWRQSTSPSGQTRIEKVPRTREEFLDPQEGDEMGQDSLHFALLVMIYSIFKMRYPLGGEITVFADFVTRLKVGKNATPDLCLVRGVKDPERRRKSFRVGQEPGEIVLAIEIVSPEYAFKDYEHNPRLFARAGIPEYLIIDPPETDLSKPYKLSGHRLDGSGQRYRKIPLDPQGRLYSQIADVFFAPGSEGGLMLVEGQTQERLLPPEEGLQEAERALQEAEQARQKAEQARQETEQQARQEAEQARQKIAELEAELSRARGGEIA